MGLVRASITRRQFVVSASVAGAGLLAGCGRLPWQAGLPPRVARVAFLAPDSAPSASPHFEAFRQGLRELGYVEGQDLVIDARYAEGELGQLPTLAAELVRLGPDVLVTALGPPTQAAIQATTTIPIVFLNVADPVGQGFIASLARPGGNVTGVSNLYHAMSGKRLELLKAAVPSTSHVAALGNPSAPSAALDWSAMREAAGTLGVEIHFVEVRNDEDLAGAFESIAHDHTDALIALASPLLTVQAMPQLAEFVARSRQPAMLLQRADVEAGGLMSSGPSFAGMTRRAAYYADRILKGAKPADLPVEQPMTFDFVVNLKTGRELGITFPNEILLQITEVIDP
jgi:putative ABC transport system substrate-binding protein